MVLLTVEGESKFSIADDGGDDADATPGGLEDRPLCVYMCVWKYVYVSMCVCVSVWYINTIACVYNVTCSMCASKKPICLLGSK